MEEALVPRDACNKQKVFGWFVMNLLELVLSYCVCRKLFSSYWSKKKFIAGAKLECAHIMHASVQQMLTLYNYFCIKYSDQIR